MILKDQAIFGIIWNGLGKTVNQAVQFAIMVVLARLLTPSDFGIIAIALIFTRLITLLNEMGIAAAVIQRSKIEDDDLYTLFTSSIVSGVILTGVLILISPYLARFFDKQILEPVLKVLSITLIIGSLGVIQKSLLNRAVNFKKITKVEVSGVIVYGVVSIILAGLGYGIWSIVWGTITNHIVCTSIFWIKSDWKPKLMFHFGRFKQLIIFGLNVFGTNLVNFVGLNIASFVTGKFLGMASLGIYNLANSITSQTVGRLSFIIGRVMFPTLSKMQDDNERFSNAYIKVLQFIAIISFPILIGITVIAKPFILVVFGEKWSGSIFPLQALALIAIIRSIGNTVGFVLLSKGRSDIEFKWNVLHIIVFTGLLLYTVQYGLNVLVIGIVAINLIGIPIIQKITYSLIDLTLTRVVKTLLPIFLSALLMGVLVFVFDYFIAGYVSSLVLVILSIILGSVSYLSFLFIFNSSQMNELKNSFSDSLLIDEVKKVRNIVSVK